LEESITSKKRAKYPPKLNIAQVVGGSKRTPSDRNIHPVQKGDDTQDEEPKDEEPAHMAAGPRHRNSPAQLVIVTLFMSLNIYESQICTAMRSL
jgi:hypothetical protein